MHNVCLSGEQNDEICTLCNGQSKSQYLKVYQVGCVISSTAHKVHRFIHTGSQQPEGLIKTVMNYNRPFSTPATQWGLDNEQCGVTSLVKHVSSVGHVGLTVEQRGLLTLNPLTVSGNIFASNR